ncbi:Hpt domain-containing protein, partial [Arhodomonas sp. KWT]
EHAETLVNGDPDDEGIMAVAEALLSVEAALRHFAEGHADDAEPGEASGFQAEYESVHDQALEEARREMARIREAIVRDLEAGQGEEAEASLAASFHSLQGVGRFLSMSRFSELVGDAARVTAGVLRTPGPVDDTTLDDMADAITSLEYYLEAVSEGRHEVEPILDMAASVLERLVPIYAVAEEPDGPVEGGDTAPEEDAGADGAAPPADEQPLLDLGDAVFEGVSADTPAEVSAPAEPPPELDSSLETDAEGAANAGAGGDQAAAQSAPAIDFASKRGRVDHDVPVRAAEPDPEILEIFMEEVGEVLETLNECFPAWRGNPDDRDSLLTTRRMFHTLKGSGRLAGALLLGELAWSVENLLNRILDGSRDATSPVF